MSDFYEYLESLRDKNFQERYKIGAEIGRGNSAIVYLGKRKKDQKLVAIKQINLTRFESEVIKQLIQESQLLQKYKNIELVQLIDLCFDGTYLYLVLEYCSRGSLADFLNQFPNGCEEPIVRYLAHTMSMRLCQLRMENILHRDLKLENFLLTDDFNIKLADLGLAKLASNQSQLQIVGSIVTIPPEIQSGKGSYSYQSDIWALGVMIYQLTFGHKCFPFKISSDMEANLKAFEQPIQFNHPKQISKDAKDLIQNILKIDPAQRIKIEEVIYHPFLQIESPENYAASLKQEFPPVVVQFDAQFAREFAEEIYNFEKDIYEKGQQTIQKITSLLPEELEVKVKKIIKKIIHHQYQQDLIFQTTSGDLVCIKRNQIFIKNLQNDLEVSSKASQLELSALLSETDSLFLQLDTLIIKYVENNLDEIFKNEQLKRRIIQLCDDINQLDIRVPQTIKLVDIQGSSASILEDIDITTAYRDYTPEEPSKNLMESLLIIRPKTISLQINLSEFWHFKNDLICSRNQRPKGDESSVNNELSIIKTILQ